MKLKVNQQICKLMLETVNLKKMLYPKGIHSNLNILWFAHILRSFVHITYISLCVCPDTQIAWISPLWSLRVWVCMALGMAKCGIPAQCADDKMMKSYSTLNCCDAISIQVQLWLLKWLIWTIIYFSEAEPDSSSLQQLPDLPSCNSTVLPCKSETISCQEDAIFQLAKEIESVANTLLDEQCNNTLLPSELNASKTLPPDSENATSDAEKDQNISPPITVPNDQNFKPSVTALPYSMLDMSNVQNDASLNTTTTINADLLVLFVF